MAACVRFPEWVFARMLRTWLAAVLSLTLVVTLVQVRVMERGQQR